MSLLQSDGPQVAVGAVVVHLDQVLLVQRRYPPTAGCWAIPGGRQLLGETMQQAAEREIREETGVIIRATQPVYTTEYIEHDERGRLCYHYIIVDLAAEYLAGVPKGGDDAGMAAWVAWPMLADLFINASSQLALKTLFPLETANYLPVQQT
ncbi:MAG: NUDIX hydrolase [Thiohalomonadaceae bacterium]